MRSLPWSSASGRGSLTSCAAMKPTLSSRTPGFMRSMTALLTSPVVPLFLGTWTVIASERAIRAIDTMFESSGGRALATGTYLQRAWRDAHAGRVHAANDPERALQMFGALEFGHKIDPGMY